jgi:hypothetical protein
MSKQLFALSTSIGVLAGIWTAFAVAVPMLGPMPFVLWPTFAAWATFFYAGASVDGMLKGLIQLFTGAILSFILMSAFVALGAPGPAPLVLGIIVMLIAWTLTAISGVSKWWAQVPAGFCGAALYFGVAGTPALVEAKQVWTSMHLLATLFPILAGQMLGYLSNYLASFAQPMKAPAHAAG